MASYESHGVNLIKYQIEQLEAVKNQHEQHEMKLRIIKSNLTSNHKLLLTTR